MTSQAKSNFFDSSTLEACSSASEWHSDKPMIFLCASGRYLFYPQIKEGPPRLRTPALRAEKWSENILHVFETESNQTDKFFSKRLL